MIPELSSLAARVREFISGCASGHVALGDSFQRLALDLFALQFQHVEPYRRLCEARGVKPGTVLHWWEIPAVPTSAFKEFELGSLAPEERTHWFRSSGTTGQAASRHFHSAESLVLYEDSLLAWWRANVMVGAAADSSPSPFNGERAGVRGEKVGDIANRTNPSPGSDSMHATSKGSLVRLTPHPQSLSPLRGEGSQKRGDTSSRFGDAADGRVVRVRLLMLTPPPESAPHSSLVHMFATLRREFGSEDSVFLGKVDDDGGWGVNAETAVQCLSGHAQFRSRRREEVDHFKFGTRNSELGIPGAPSSVGGHGTGVAPVVVMGAAFSFVHLLDWMTERRIRLCLPAGSKVMETGGYKGRSRELAKAELHRLITDRLGVSRSNIICEYGMSELSSQAYDVQMRKAEGGRRNKDRVFRFPPWARVRIISPETGKEVGEDETGLIQVFDLAKVWSVLAVQTEDLGVRRGDGFEFVGRAAFSESRGCSLMAV